MSDHTNRTQDRAGSVPPYDAPPYDAEERRALREAFPAESLSEDRIAAAVFDAASQRQRPAAPPVRPRRHRLFSVRYLAAAATVVLASAGAWHWSGSNSDDLDIPAATRVLRAPGQHTEENLLAAIGRVDRLVVGIIDKLNQNQVLTKSLRQRCLAALDAPAAVRTVTIDPQEIEQITAQTSPLAPGQEKVVLSAVRACASSLRAVAQVSNICSTYASIARRNIKARLAGVPGSGAAAAKQPGK